MYIKEFIKDRLSQIKQTPLGINFRRQYSRLKPTPYIKDDFSQIEIETTTFCNRKCTYCPNSEFERFGPSDNFYMLDDVFKKLINDLSKGNFSGEIAPHHYGEPLSDPSIYSKIEFIHKKLPLAKILITTNGDYLNEKTYKKLLDLGTKIIKISKHSKDLAPDCEKLINKINSNLKDYPVIPRVFDFWKDFNNDQSSLFNRGGDIQKIKKAKWRPIKCIYASYPVINVYGDLILCCQDYQSKYILGNIMKDSIYKIWRNPENKRLRERILRSYFDNEICQQCLFATV